MFVKAEIISIGTEILLGEITDTNASYLAAELPRMGIDLYWISQVGDNRGRIVEVLKRAWQRSDIILITGGLGPTDDDVTRESIAEMFGEKMEIDPSLERALRARFGQMGREMPLSNLKQAALIPSAQSIPNPAGTAPGWWVERDGRTLIAMPGPPRELNEVWPNYVQPRLAQRADSILVPRTIKTFGLSEGGVGEMVSTLLAAANPTLGIYAKPDGIHLRLAAKAKSREQAEKMLDEGEASIRAILNDYIWGVDNDTPEIMVGRLLAEKGLTLAVMEDSGGGWLSTTMGEIAESHTFFKGGLFACSDDTKVAFGVSPEVISRCGSASLEVAQAMAEAAKTFLKADIGIGITGIEGTKENPMGAVYIGTADRNGSRAVARPRRRQYLTSTIMFELRQLLLTL
jgi:nicotinamide-nucleotide amidase